MTSVVKKSFIYLPDAALSRIYKTIIRRHLDYAMTIYKPNNESFKFQKKSNVLVYTLFHSQLRSGLSPQSCLYFQGFGVQSCLVVLPSNLCL